ncbi:MAG: hypothetical protein KDD06_12935, partial [Phaeodactylibacter sp.]|nr:hypothetical protein [Phaeodactylibacter sp.]
MKHLYRLLALSAFFIGLKLAAVAQESQKPREAQVSQNGPEKKQEDDSYKPLVLKLSEDGSKYVRFLLWHQHWVQTNNLA